MIGLNCKEVTRRLASDESVTANWPDRLLVGLHLFLCDKCRRYKSQMETMGKAAKELWPKPADEVRLRSLEENVLKRFDE